MSYTENTRLTFLSRVIERINKAIFIRTRTRCDGQPNDWLATRIPSIVAEIAIANDWWWWCRLRRGGGSPIEIRDPPRRQTVARVERYQTQSTEVWKTKSIHICTYIIWSGRCKINTGRSFFHSSFEFFLHLWMCFVYASGVFLALLKVQSNSMFAATWSTEIALYKMFYAGLANAFVVCVKKTDRILTSGWSQFFALPLYY